MGAAVASRPMRADAQRNYDRIVEVASDAFAERGVLTSLDDIACRAGVGPGTLYRHFPTRDGLIAAALGDSLGRLEALSTRLTASDDPAAALDEWMLALEPPAHLRQPAGIDRSGVPHRRLPAAQLLPAAHRHHSRARGAGQGGRRHPRRGRLARSLRTRLVGGMGIAAAPRLGCRAQADAGARHLRHPLSLRAELQDGASRRFGPTSVARLSASAAPTAFAPTVRADRVRAYRVGLSAWTVSASASSDIPLPA